MAFIKDLFGWFKPSPEARMPHADGTLPYRLRGGPWAGVTLYLTAGVTETLTVRTPRWHGRYEKATEHTFNWKDTSK
jgi:hypothetical protein